MLCTWTAADASESHISGELDVAADYNVGNVVMYRVARQGARAPGDEWAGPARVIGFDGQVVWLQSAGQPIASAIHMLRPSSTPELLAWQVRSRTMQATAACLQEPTEGQQEGYIDARDPCGDT